jgi:hypothetical protein
VSVVSYPIASSTLAEKIALKALKWGVSAEVMQKVINCESGGNRLAVGDFGDSIGLVQINLPSWPDISYDQATDENFSLDFLARQLSLGNGHLWTCYRQLVSSTS